MKSPYQGKDESQWEAITKRLIQSHPLKENEIAEVVLKSWGDIFNSKIGSFYIGKEIFPSPQIMSFFLHELVAHYLGQRHPGVFRVGTEKHEKDIHHESNPELSVEIKASSHSSQIFGNRSYAQPESGIGRKSKTGFYLTINFEGFDRHSTKHPEILMIRFGYLEHSDWIAQKAATGQQARLKPEVYRSKLKVLYEGKKN